MEFRVLGPVGIWRGGRGDLEARVAALSYVSTVMTSNTRR